MTDETIVIPGCKNPPGRIPGGIGRRIKATHYFVIGYQMCHGLSISSFSLIP
jgi:hypothetical protein